MSSNHRGFVAVTVPRRCRSYIPILFNYITFATRFTTSMAVGRDELRFQVDRPSISCGVQPRGYRVRQLHGLPADDGSSCNAEELIGSRVAFANAELRFPIIRRYANAALLGRLHRWVVLLRCRPGLVEGSEPGVLGARRLTSRQRTAQELRVRPAHEPVQHCHHPLGLGEAGQPTRRQGIRDLVLRSQLLTNAP